MRILFSTVAAWVAFHYMPTYVEWMDGRNVMQCPLGVTPPHDSCKEIIILPPR